MKDGQQTCLVNWLWNVGNGGSFGMCALLDKGEQETITHRLREADETTDIIEDPSVVPVSEIRRHRASNLFGCVEQLRMIMAANGVASKLLDHAFDALDHDEANAPRPEVEIAWVYDDGENPAELQMMLACLSQREEETLHQAMKRIEYGDDRVNEVQVFMPIMKPEAAGVDATAEELATSLQKSARAHDVDHEVVEAAAEALQGTTPAPEPA